MGVKNKKLVVLLIGLAMVISMLVGCTKPSSNGSNSSDGKNAQVSEGSSSTTQDAGDDTTPLTLKVFLKNELKWDTPVGREITKKTGITLDFLPIAGDPNEKLNLMLASNDLPDIISISRGADANEKYIKSKAVIPLDDLIDKYVRSSTNF